MPGHHRVTTLIRTCESKPVLSDKVDLVYDKYTRDAWFLGREPDMSDFVVKDGWISGAVKRPVQSKGRARLKVVNRVNLHIAVSNAQSLYTSFDEKNEVDSHLYVRHGTRAQINDPEGMADFEQYVPLTHNAYADLDGNDGGWSIETAGGVGSDAVVGKWDAAQLRRLAWLWKHLREHGKIPNKLATSSKLYSIESQGLSWHRLGIDGNFPNGELGGRLQRGATSTTDPRYMHYSKHWGKACPTPERIKQIRDIHAMSQKPVATTPSKPKPKPTPKPVEKKREPQRMPTIKYGSRGEPVIHWQRFLKAVGYYKIDVDGIFGDETAGYTKNYQQANGLVPDKVVGPFTWCEALLEFGRINLGDHNVAVGIWQNIIQVNDDYDFGPRTKAATEEVQRFLKVDDDAIVWTKTVDALRKWW